MLLLRQRNLFNRQTWLKCISSRSKLYSTSPSTTEPDGGEEAKEEPIVRTRGRKLKPEKHSIVVLTPSQTGIYDDMRRSKFTIDRITVHRASDAKSRLKGSSILEGVELDTVTRENPSVVGSSGTTKKSDLQKTDREETDSGISRDLLKDTAKLLNFKSKSSEEQLFQSIDLYRPAQLGVSNDTYMELERQLMDSFTAKQLKAYINSRAQGRTIPTSHRTKRQLVDQIFATLWRCEITKGTITLETKRIKLNRRHAKLLLITQNGKILMNLTRLSKNLSIQLNLSLNELKITGERHIIKYIEVALNNILNNICVTQWTDDPQLNGDPLERQQFNQITKICGVDIDLENNEIAALDWRRIHLAKRLYRWARTNNKIDNLYRFETIDQFGGGPAVTGKDIQWYPYNDSETLDWLAKDEQWGRLQRLQEISRNTSEGDTAISQGNLSEIIADERLDKMYDYIVKETTYDDDSRVKPMTGLIGSQSNVFTITLGQIIQTKDGSKHMFEPRVPNLVRRLLALPYYDSPREELQQSVEEGENEGSKEKEEEDADSRYDIDQNISYLELEFSPSKDGRAHGVDGSMKLPPIKLILELDENDNVMNHTVQCIAHLLNREFLLQTPQLPYDYKITHDRIVSILEDDQSGDLLQDQQGIKDFLTYFNFKSLQSIKFLNHLKVNIPRETPRGREYIEADYDYITLSHHRIVRLKYLDKYIVQLSEIDGGSLGGRYVQIDFVDPTSTNDEGGLSRDEFKTFVRDVLKV